MIPLYHDFEGRTVLIFGGGRVGARKARHFDSEARVVVVSPTFGDEAEAFGGARLVRAAPRPADESAFDGESRSASEATVADWIERTDPVLVVAATDDAAVNETAARAARERGALVNRADESAATRDRDDGERPDSDVVVPATVRDGPVTVAVATGGRSPALAGHLRRTIGADLDGAGEMAELTAGLRRRLRDAEVSANDRREAVRAVTQSSAVWKGLRTGDANASTEAMRVVAAVLDCSPGKARALVGGSDPTSASADGDDDPGGTIDAGGDRP